MSETSLAAKFPSGAQRTVRNRPVVNTAVWDFPQPLPMAKMATTDAGARRMARSGRE